MEQAQQGPVAGGRSAAPARGDVLAERYHLDEQLDAVGLATTWRGRDAMLSRSVVVHVLDPQAPTTPGVLSAARRASVATDSRFLRVLDALDEPVPFIVCEDCPGTRLRELLSYGALSGVESAFVVREIADALSPMHTRGVFHRRLTPESIIITPNGNVKVVGFLIDAALSGEAEGPAADPAVQESEDVRALGKILYACLTQRWPIPAERPQTREFGLTAAPMTSPEVSNTPRWVPPIRVNPKTPSSLDAVSVSILTPRAGTNQIRSVDQIVRAMNRVIGAADPDGDLEQRVRALAGRAGMTGTGMTPRIHALAEPVQEPLVGDDLVEQAERQRITREAAEQREALLAERAEAAARINAEKVHRAQAAARAHERANSWEGTRTYRLLRWMAPLFVAVMLVIAVPGMVHSFMHDGVRRAAAQAPVPVPFTAESFDPVADGGEGGEHADEAVLVSDSDTGTAWRTDLYSDSASFNGLKPGSGLLLDLGRPVSLDSLSVRLVGEPTAIQIMVPKDAENPSHETVNDWTTVATDYASGVLADFTFDAGLEAHYVLVYLTSLPPVDGGWQGGIGEITVTA
ncbi:protein kinase family protein [uncultured Propionibacterium sp.]|uniref:protein kinase family protein n=1 Tax=uncultured Propionibacterium sp. TaxID=218066 RepID=UPI00292FB626|nr:protein kinase family protein [uncultured Propionibacterium sp.]